MDSKARSLRRTPGLALAQQKAKRVKPGAIMQTALTGSDATDLVGVEGASFIVKLPESAPENNRPYIGTQWFVNGKPVYEEIRYGGRYRESYVERTRTWLVDVAVFPDPFSQDHRRVTYTVRAQSLMDYGGLTQRGPLQFPEAAALDPQSLFFFKGAGKGAVEAGIDIPLGCWFQLGKNGEWPRGDVVKVAESAPVACVFYFRLQKNEPGK